MKTVIVHCEPPCISQNRYTQYYYQAKRHYERGCLESNEKIIKETDDTVWIEFRR